MSQANRKVKTKTPTNTNLELIKKIHKTHMSKHGVYPKVSFLNANNDNNEDMDYIPDQEDNSYSSNRSVIFQIQNNGSIAGHGLNDMY